MNDQPEQITCSDRTHLFGCPCMAGGEVELLADQPISGPVARQMVGRTVRVTNAESSFQGLRGRVVRVVADTLMVEYGPKVGHFGALPFGRGEVEFES